MEAYELRPELAEKWEVSPDAKTYTFHLRPTKWADMAPINGEFTLEAATSLIERVAFECDNAEVVDGISVSRSCLEHTLEFVASSDRVAHTRQRLAQI